MKELSNRQLKKEAAKLHAMLKNENEPETDEEIIEKVEKIEEEVKDHKEFWSFYTHVCKEMGFSEEDRKRIFPELEKEAEKRKGELASRL